MRLQVVNLREAFRKHQQESGEVRRGGGRQPGRTTTVTPQGALTEHMLGVSPAEGRGRWGGCPHTPWSLAEVHHVDVDPQAASGAGRWEAGRERTKY